MRVMFIGFTLCCAACSASKPVHAPAILARKTAVPETGALPPEAKIVHCAEPTGGCFDTAKVLCGGPWHQVAEPGMAFPAIVSDEQGGYRMLVVCGS